MKNIMYNTWNRTIAYMLTIGIILGTIFMSLTSVYAEGMEHSDMEVIVNPLYAEHIDNAEICSELAILREQANSGIELFSEPEVFDSDEEAIAYIRQQMVCRNTNITMLIKKNVLSGDVRKLFESAMEHSEECTGQEGDALAWGWKGCSWGITYYFDYFQVTYTISYYTDAEQEAALTETVNAAMQSMNLDGLLEYEKVKVIHDYICENVNYDYTYQKYSAYDALCNKSAVCQGYAILFYRLCKEADLSVRIITGLGNGGNHAWNIVQIGGRYYNVDCTWDGQSDNTYTTYLLKSEKDFTDHVRDAKYVTEEFLILYPMTEGSWKDYSLFEEGISQNNLNISFTSLEDEVVTSIAEGKPKVLVFYDLDSGHSRQTLIDISNSNPDDVDVIAIEVFGKSKDEIKAFRDTYALNNIKFTYCEDSYIEIRNMSKYALLAGHDDYVVFPPYFVYINGQNIVQHVTGGYDGAGIVEDNIRYYCNEMIVPTSTVFEQNSIQLDVGERGKVTAIINPDNATIKLIGYESADKSIARVDCNGNVTAISEGKTVITAYAVDAASITKSTCEIEVIEKEHLHSYQYTVTKEPTISAIGSLTGTCKCGETMTVTLPRLTTEDYDYTIQEESGCTTEGIGLYNWKTITYGSFYFDVTLPATGHIYGYKVTQEPTTSAIGTLTGTCSRCDGTTTVTLPKLTTDDYDYTIQKATSCTASGTGRYTWKTTTYGSFNFDVMIPAIGHNYSNGKCTHCGTDDPNYVANHPVTEIIIDKTLSLTFGETATLIATITPENATKKELMWSSSDTNIAIVSENGLVTAIGSGTTTITATATDGSRISASCEVTVTTAINFEDVVIGSYYEQPVQWAVENSITNGYGSDTIFNPEGTCTRGQIVTFLWRANGSPEPSSLENPFTDVSSSEYYYKAVLWAVENGITAGYGSDTIFNPDGACTRAQVATFMWRAAGKPDMSGAVNPFTDLEEGSFYYDAVLWAVENEITNGYGSAETFCPEITCTRGQIVTFLYRGMQGE